MKSIVEDFDLIDGCYSSTMIRPIHSSISLVHNPGVQSDPIQCSLGVNLIFDFFGLVTFFSQRLIIVLQKGKSVAFPP
jgi:hypothetical protein